MWRIFAAAILLATIGRSQDSPAKVPPPLKTPALKTEDQPKPKPVERKLTGIERQRLSVERQMQAIRVNYPPPFAGSSGDVVLAAPAAADCPPVTMSQVKPIIDREATRQKMDARLVQAVVEAESGYSPCAVSPVGAMGLMQLMPSTAESLQVSDPYDPSQNITAGTQYLKQMLERYGGDIAKALAAYNAGPARVDAAGGIPSIPETQEYVRKIMGKITPVRPVE